MENIKTKTIFCTFCGKCVEVNGFTNRNVKYCFECREKVTKERDKARYERKKQSKTVKESNGKPTLSDIERMARESGMTYGKFCAKMKI